MRKLNWMSVIREATFEEMERDSSVILIGEDVRLSIFGASTGLLETFGEDRVLNTPISEGGFLGAGIGAAMVGMRPIVDMAMASFMYVAMDQFVSMASKTTYTYGGQFSVPLVVRAGLVYGVNNAAQHSDRPHPMFMNVPGLKIIAPSNALDLYGMLKSAIRDDDPVICFEDWTISGARVDIPEAEEDFTIPLGVGKVVQEGTDITLIGISGCVERALEAAAILAEEGISAEVVDPRTLVPLDKELLLNSVRKTGRVVISDPAHKTCSAASEIAAIVAEEAFHALKGPVQVVATADVPIPFSSALEPQVYPSAEKIVAAAKRTFE